MLGELRDEKLAKLYSDTKDERFFEELYRRHVGYVQKFVHRFVFNKKAGVDQQGVVDDTFQALHRACVEKREVTDVQGYLILKAKLFTLAEINRNSMQRRTATRLEPMLREPADKRVLDPYAELIREQVSRLPDDESRAVYTVYLLGADLSTAAGELGVSLATLKRRLKAGIERLRKRITPEML